MSNVHQPTRQMTMTTTLTTNYNTSHMTGRHRGLKRKLRAGDVCAAHFCKFFYFLVTRGLEFSIPCAYFVYMVRHCTGQHCSSMYAFMHRLLAGMRRPLVTVITMLYYVAKNIFHRRIACFRCAMRIRRLGIILIPRLPLCQISFLSWPPLLS